jgi:hypothetical protein
MYVGLMQTQKSTSVPEAVAAVSNSGPASSYHTLTEALREKILRLEQQLTGQAKLLHRREAELEKKDSKLRSVNSELAQLRSDHAQELQRLQSEVVQSIQDSLRQILLMFALHGAIARVGDHALPRAARQGEGRAAQHRC